MDIDEVTDDRYLFPDCCSPSLFGRGFEEERESGRVRKHATIYLFVFSAKYFFIRNDRFERNVAQRTREKRENIDLFRESLRYISEYALLPLPFCYIYECAMCVQTRFFTNRRTKTTI